MILVHTITPRSSLLHASHLILATSSSRIFLRTPYASAGANFNAGFSPPLSPTPSLSTSQTSPPSSPSVSSLSLSDLNIGSSINSVRVPAGTSTGLPPAPSTQLSPHYVVSITDILASLARAYKAHLPVPSKHPTASATTASSGAGWEFALDPETMSRKRRQSIQASALSAASESLNAAVAAVTVTEGGQTLGLDSWKWATHATATAPVQTKPQAQIKQTVIGVVDPDPDLDSQA